MCQRVVVGAVLLGFLPLLGFSAGCRDGSRNSIDPPGLPPAAPNPPPVAGPAPSISSVSPSTGVPTGATYVEILGAGLGPGTIVTFDGVRAAIRGWSPGGGSLAVLTPVHPAGTVNVAVTNQDGQSSELTGGFTYGLAAPLIIATLSPVLGSMAGGTFLYIRGTGLQPGLRVTLDGVDARVLYASATGRVSPRVPMRQER
jgi:large repetitive protein